MGIESLPSKNAALIDVPEVEDFGTKFEYNYWTADEFENGLGSSEAALQQLPSETFDANYVSRTRKLPRLIKLSWKPITMNRDKNKPENRIKIKDYLDKVHSEETFTSNDYTSIRYQDTETDTKLKFFLDQFLQRIPGSDIANSPMEKAELANQHTPDEVSPGFLREVLGSFQETKGLFFDSAAPQAGKIVEETLLERIKNVALNARLNNRLLIPLANTVQKDSLGIFADEFTESKFMNDLKHIQDSAIANSNANLMSPLDYEFEVLSYVDYRAVDTIGYEPAVQALGYVINKRELRSDGTAETYAPIVVENSFTGVTFDGQIRYGSVYYYKIRAVYQVDVHAIDQRSKKNVVVSFLIGSKWSSEQMVRTLEMVPPPPPADFNVAWDYGEKALRCTWNLPVNTQQDIKYIQLFRRRNINEPFQLIRMWDFNDTKTKVPVAEYPLPELVKVVPSFVGIFLDREFGKDSTFIYAACAVDAHGLTSNYSIQFEASFNHFSNRLVKKLVSKSGAPKQYPNAYLNADTFVDTIRDSGHNSIRVIFNPEYLEFVNKAGSDLGLLKTDRVNGKYRLQLINIDLQSQQTVDIVLKDSRTTMQTVKVSNLGPSNLGSKINRQR